jgi:hypothetical protein
MFRFTTRDVLWLMVVVGLACGWWVERKQAVVLQSDKVTLLQSHEIMRQAIEILEADHDRVVNNLPRNEPIYAEDKRQNSN